MENNSAKPTKFNPIVLILGLNLALLTINVIFIVFTRNSSLTTKILNQQLLTLKQEKTILASTSNLYSTYQSQINTLSQVFPNEETITTFIQSIETLSQSHAGESSLKFISTTPTKEQGYLTLILDIKLKTTTNDLISFLNQLEHLPYMTHVTSIISKPSTTPNVKDIAITLKVYVQNPFSD